MGNDATFIGIDLAWRTDGNHTGAAVMKGSRRGADLIAIADPIRTLDGVRQFVAHHSGRSTFLAIDAPLIIQNPTGQRPCETAVGRRYGSREASCHTSNQRLYPAAASVALASELTTDGYVHAPDARAADDKVILEVYPHAGLVALFDLPKSLKYKKGNLAQKRRGLQTLATYIRKLNGATTARLERFCRAIPLAFLAQS